MGLTVEQKQDLGVALNEAAFLGACFDAANAVTLVTLRVLSWDDAADEPAYPTINLLLVGTARLSAALRNSVWHDRDADVVEFEVDALDEIVRSFGPTDLYGWDYIDGEVGQWEYWQHRLSLDHKVSDVVAPHHIDLFKEDWVPAQPRTLDLRFWFHGLIVELEDGEAIPLDEFIRCGKRWWDAMYAGDPRTSHTGIVRG